MNWFNLKLLYLPGHYVPELNGIRGLAILLVILFHCFPCFLTSMGWIGVNLFFVLSGFLITGILIDSKQTKNYYINFIGRRALRIFPLYYLVLFTIFFIAPRFLKSILPPHFNFYLEHKIWFWLYIENWLFSFNGFPKNLILSHFWSLAVEEQFYLFWPWVILFVRVKYLLRLSIGLCLFAFVYRVLPLGFFDFLPHSFSSTYRYLNTLSRLDGLLIGSIIAQLIRVNRGLLERIAIPVGVVGLLIFLVGAVFNMSFRFMELPFYYTAMDLFMGMILVMSLSDISWIRNVMSHNILTFLGRYSYGLYVYHVIIYMFLKYNIDKWLATFFENFWIRMLIMGVLTIVLSLLVSILSYRLFEVRFLKLKGYFRANKAGSKVDNREVGVVLPV